MRILTLTLAASAALSACAKDGSESGAADAGASATVSTVDSPRERVTTVTGGGPVIQILPGPNAVADSAEPIIQKAPAAKQEMLHMLAKNGPFSDKVAVVDGAFNGVFWDRGDSGSDSVAATATFTADDGARWRVVIDRIAPEDEGPMDPHWGGVGTDMTYHGSTGLGVPLVPTVRASVSYYGMSSLYRNEKLVDSAAATHVMLTSQTRHKGNGSDFAYTCWDCTKFPVEQLHLMIMPPMGKMYQVPGGIIHVMWQKSQGNTRSSP